jgi:predicted RNase H-like HicB family nuclease
MNRNYSMIIQWSDEDQTFVVSLPEFGPYAHTHGDTYEKAAQQGRDYLESLIEAYQAEGRALPEPVRFDVSEPTKPMVA